MHRMMLARPTSCGARALLALAWALILITTPGCDERPEVGQTDDGQFADPQARRVVSLSPALTQIVVDLGAGDRLVGIDSNYPYPGQAPEAESVGNLRHINDEQLIALEPTDVLVQVEQGNTALADLRNMARQFGWRVHTIDIRTIPDVQQAVYSLPPSPSVSVALDMPRRGRELAEAFEERLEAVTEAVLQQEDMRFPGTLVLTSTGPAMPMAAGVNTFIDQMLTYAGGRNVLGRAEGAYPMLDKEAIETLQPEVIVILHARAEPPPEGMPPVLSDLDVPAVRDNRVHYLHDRMAQIPSTTIPRVTAKLAKLLHPGAGELFDAIMAGDDASDDQFTPAVGDGPTAPGR